MHRLTTMLILLAVAGCTSKGPDPIPEIRPGVPAGYLASDELPNAFAFIPPPPKADSAAMQADIAANEAALAARGTPRFDQASVDAILSFPDAASRFQCELGTIVSEQHTPALYRLLRRSMIDTGRATYTAKIAYSRERPFMVNGEPTCTPEAENRLRQDGSYPSGHSSLGWGWGLILSSMDPQNASQILKRGWEFGQSRAVCNVHWQSDVDAGRLVAAATVVQLYMNPVFMEDFEKGKEELAEARAAGLSSEIDCP